MLLRNFRNFCQTHVRNYATKKRFYRGTGILRTDGEYEVTLDQRRLKTPMGHKFTVQNEALAIMVAAEWDAQTDLIKPSSMHLNALCSTVIDNPNKLTKMDNVNYMVNYLMTDALLFQTDQDDELYKLQTEKWDPIIQWFCDRYAVNLKKTRGIEPPKIDPETKMILSKHLLSYNFAAVNGFTYGVDTLKSLILMMACAERRLSPEEAVTMSRLEEDFQAGYWGRVEWAHDLSQQELQCRLSAAILFVHLNSMTSQIQSKAVHK